jgi:phosphorylcholine metabolism protein LicD
LFFFGTLLGLVREKNLIEGDDDVDFYVNINEREKLISILKLNFIVVDETLSVNKNKSFLQVFRFYNDVKFIIDFYFYDSNKDKFNIIEKWNFEGGRHTHSIQTS